MKTNAPKIRPYDPATDLKKLSNIWLEASLLAHHFMGKEYLVERQPLIEEVYFPMAETWVACVDDEPAGFISLVENHIGGIFVHPERHGQGIGRSLIAHALTLRDELTLEVYLQNEQAVRFYQRLGFEEISRRPLDDEGMPFENAALRLRK